MSVPAAKVRRILDLANEAHEIADSHSRLQHLFNGVNRLVGADVGCLFVFDSPQAGAPKAGLLVGYSASETAAVLGEYAARGDSFDLMARNLRAAYDGTEPVFARRREELLGNRAWYNSFYVNEFRRRWGFDHSIYSIQRHGKMRLAMSVNRAFGSSCFNAADRSLIEIFHLAIARVAFESLAGTEVSSNHARRAGLTPRAREVLDHLLHGSSNKDIARQLSLSTNTVHHYCKMVFRAFDVGSRSELIARWFSAASDLP